METDYWNPYDYLVLRGQVEVIARFLEERAIWTRLYDTYDTVYYIEEETIIHLNKPVARFEFQFCKLPVIHVDDA